MDESDILDAFDLDDFVEIERLALAEHAQTATLKAWRFHAMLELGRSQEARLFLAEARSDHPDSPELMGAGAFLLQSDGDHNRAMELALLGVKLDPEGFLANWTLLNIEGVSGDPHKAVALARQNAERFNRPRFWYSLQVVSSKIDPGSEFSIQEEIAQRFPGSYISSLGQGVAALRNGQKVTARTHYLEAHRLSPNAIIPMHMLGIIYRGLRNDNEAEVWYLKALEINPEDSVSLLGLSAISRHGTPGHSS